ncbi:MAG: tRNA (N6-threonylcarbamoyladenosine(37)-N6)-methyltransferase TrmO [Terracidiphilus sp.]
MPNSQFETRAARLAIAPIGRIHTSFKCAKGTPIQGATSNDTHGFVELFPEFVSGLQDLEGFERIWLIYLLDRASDVQLIVQPYMDTKDRGVFATRSPARPNPIGLSTVRLLGVEQNRLLIADVDMLDGTPLLDIKPYVPAFDCFEHARVGWYADKSATAVVADNRFEARDSGAE